MRSAASYRRPRSSKSAAGAFIDPSVMRRPSSRASDASASSSDASQDLEASSLALFPEHLRFSHGLFLVAEPTSLDARFHECSLVRRQVDVQPSR